MKRNGHGRATPDPEAVGEPNGPAEPEGTTLARLCRYYLACMSWEDSSLSLARSQAGRTFVELPDHSPDAHIPRQGPASQLLEIQGLPGRQLDLVLGSPILLRRRGRRLLIEPVLLCHVTTGRAGGPLRPLPASMGLNPRAVQFLSGCGQDATEAVVAGLEEELGLGLEVGPGIEETIARLRSLRASWDWLDAGADEDDPNRLPVQSLEQVGIHCRTVIALRERSDYMIGLASELNALAELSDGDVRGTALEAWLSASFPAEKETKLGPLLDLPPQNAEQRRAIEASFRRGLTVVTGPPGTGKSQLVAGLMVNAAWRDERALLASKNNKAVDVVESRVNQLAGRPVLLRAGTGSYRKRLAAALVAVLNANVEPVDVERHEDNIAALHDLADRIDRLNSEIRDRVELRNRLDRLERRVESARAQLIETLPDRIDVKLLVSAREAATELLAMLTDQGRGTSGGFLDRLPGSLGHRSRSVRMGRLARRIEEAAHSLGFRAPDGGFLSGSGEWRRYAKEVGDRIADALLWHEYHEALKASHAEPLDEVHRRDLELRREYRSLSGETWASWIATQPTRMDAEARTAIAQQRTSLDLAAAGSELSGKAYGAFRDAMETAVSHTGIWGCTALSARSILPLKPGFFDLVVIDEASQCDVASALPLLYRAKRAMIIGDPNQLPHISGLSKAADIAALERHGLQPQFTHWSYHACSLFDLASSLAGPEARITLVEHHRSHPDIIGFSDSEFYNGRLRIVTSPRHLKTPRTRFETSHLTWVDCRGRVTQPPDGGAVNQPEAERVVETLKRLVGSSRYQGSIGVVTPFRHQANLIVRLMGRDRTVSQAAAETDIVVDTVHRFQGDERDLMIFSPVLSRDMPQSAHRFLLDTPNLFNVAVTRARAMLVVIGDRAAFRQSAGHLKAFEDYVGRVQGAAPTTTASAVPETAAQLEVPAGIEDQSSEPWIHVLYQALRDEGLRPDFRVRIETIVLDLALTSGGRKLDIEVDTEFHRRQWTLEDADRIRMRDQRVMELGWEIRRFWVGQVRDSLPQCVGRIADWAAGNG